MAEPSNPPFVENRIRALLFLQKKKDMPYEEWRHYWMGEHAQIVLGVPIVRRNFLKYEQLHVNREWKERLRQSPGMRVPDFDGVVVLEGESLEKLAEVTQDPEYIEKVVADAVNIFQLENTIQGAFNIAVIADKSAKDAKPVVGCFIREDVGRVLLPLHRKDGSSHAEFSQHWLNVHAPLFKHLLATSASISKYEQLHVQQGSGVSPGSPLDWDGVGVFEAKSLANAMEVFADERFVKIATEDGAKFVSDGQSDIFPCDVVTLIDN
ncbi:hypothetical protein E1B28_001978 [Marasmius oreades]|uniref:EthD domain-containing protein n=1 Tax=Marasmius oreades TaxID=181124 RepID=A0A9P7V4P2_9AGAR|nr:uncharacterized protein E1B28_001978 [Marasmius oreades]KAG7100203.1 hypothetical protein E1B28_001978 [Marasmius oreades]